MQEVCPHCVLPPSSLRYSHVQVIEDVRLGGRVPRQPGSQERVCINAFHSSPRREC